MKTSLQTKLFVWNSPSIFVSTIHQTVQKRSFKRDISLNNRKKKRFERFEHETVSKKKRRLEEIWSWPNLDAEQTNPFYFSTTLFPEFVSSMESKSLPFSRIDRQFIKAFEPSIPTCTKYNLLSSVAIRARIPVVLLSFRSKPVVHPTLLKGIAPKERAPTSQFSPHPPIPGVTRFNL